MKRKPMKNLKCQIDQYNKKKKIGILLCHGFTGTPQSLQNWANYLKETNNFIIKLPLLAGHGSSWQKLAETDWQSWYKSLDNAYQELNQETDKIFVCAISMGATLALHLATKYPQNIVGLVLVNPAIKLQNPLLKLLPIISKIKKTVPGVISDIKKPNIQETGYTKIPTKALKSLLNLLKIVKSELPNVKQPILIFKSTQDHVIPKTNIAIIVENIGSTKIDIIKLTNSYHVATLDNDAEKIFAQSLNFINKNFREENL